MEEEIKQLKKEVEDLKIKMISVDNKIEIYKNAMGQTVNLAFALIGSATITVLVSNVLNK